MIKDKKTAIVGSLVGAVILLTIFCCEGTKEEAPVPAVEATTSVEELKTAIEEVTSEVEELIPEVEEVIPTETVAPEETAE